MLQSLFWQQNFEVWTNYEISVKWEFEIGETIWAELSNGAMENNCKLSTLLMFSSKNKNSTWSVYRFQANIKMPSSNVLLEFWLFGEGCNVP